MSRSPSSWVCKRGAKWEAGWRDGNGRYHSKSGFLSKAQAAIYAHKQGFTAWNQVAGVPTLDKNIHEALDEFCTRSGIKDVTHNLNRYHLLPFIENLGLKTTRHLNRHTIQKWLAIVRTEGVGYAKGRNRGRAHNEGGQAIVLRIIKAFSYFCLANKWVSEVPFGKGVLQPIRAPRTESKGKYLDAEDREKFLSINPRYEVDKHLYRASMLGFFSGLRAMQVWGIKKTDFKAPDQLFVPGIKNQKDRTITLHPKAAEALQEALKVADPNSDRIFSYWVDVEAFRLSVRKHCKRVGLKGIRFHDAKHTFVSGLMDAGWSVPEVIEASGNSPSTIMVYAHAHKKTVTAKLKAFEYPEAKSAEEAQ